jgi:hypothetical protein
MSIATDKRAEFMTAIAVLADFEAVTWKAAAAVTAVWHDANERLHAAEAALAAFDEEVLARAITAANARQNEYWKRVGGHDVIEFGDGRVLKV